MKRYALATLTTLGLAFAPSVAQAKPHTPPCHSVSAVSRTHQAVKTKVACHRVKHPKKRIKRHHGPTAMAAPQSPKALAVSPPFYYGPAIPLPSATPQVELGNVPGCTLGQDPRPYLSQYRATWLRVFVSTNWEGQGLNGSALPCIQAATQSGIRVQLVIQWNNAWSPAEIASFFDQQLAPYAPYVSAVSIGNEQELQWPKISPAQYVTNWAAAEPVVARLAPQAIRIGGNIGPWGLSFLKTAVDLGLPGLQALAAHPYQSPTTFSTDELLTWAASRGLPVWFDEALNGPGAWNASFDLSLAQMAHAQVAGVWMA